MIEVEIRGKLSPKEYSRLRGFFGKEGKKVEEHKREMYLLFDYPGYSHDPTERKIDIRLRNTDGFCEIMLKRKVSTGNQAREEVSLPLKENTLDKAKEVVKALGCKKGLKMIREKLVYEHEGIEWSLVNCPPKDIKYYEAEIVVENKDESEEKRKELVAAAEKLGVKVLNDERMKEFIYMLDKEVNEVVEL
ncbi:MAG: hypothetical protein COT91_03180 [Candidatus Doudnabacteria bacterium CG10_big_fil_rev_8_21_14_0_10_41_10]|uniref:CYTH domain-containing protein n=1 Tax=Candidatus Doudnabacteria bacterium CG10_big_fil_rev_8_21_14_0_10_41_10 TaxID=1974551 RepID=A0A2H0VDC8_9BACT|nr:MAG: hypothetical protein COT91_03180 [Candidatus Doudnabacteria bacterium CG10_big_fil_rev_8_21_14_0_10_41_10]